MAHSLRVFWLAVALLAASVSTSQAAKPRAVAVPIAPGTVSGAAAHTQDVCTLGAVGPATFAVNYLLYPNDRYFTHLECAACPDTQSHAFSEVHVALRFQAACQTLVAISAFAAQGDSTCRMPDTLQSLIAPELFVLVHGAADPLDKEFVFHLGHTVSFQGDAFLSVNFCSIDTACASLAEQPELLTGSSCSNCQTWNYSVAGNQDLCAVALPGPPVMYVVESPCTTPVLPRSWGALKLRYR